MATVFDLPPPPPIAPEPYRLTVEQYERLGAAGVLTEDDRVELLDGILVRKLTKGEPHSFSCTELRRPVEKLMPRGWYLRLDSPVRIPGFDEPEPDLAVVRGSARRYVRLKRPPLPSEVALAIEIAESSLLRDRTEKMQAYARGRIPTYWIVNLLDRKVEIYTRPRGARYLACELFGPGQDAPVVIAGTCVGTIVVASILP
jgi:Uma2 family endonuclease